MDRHELGITSAPALIRRKIGFGTELAESGEDLARSLVSLQEESKISNFHELKLQSMIALIVSWPVKMGKWFSAIFFDGDVSESQRSIILVALGLSARELAGYGKEDAKKLQLPVMADTSFPSERLPESMERLFFDSPITSLTKELSQASLEPLAANAADTVSGPNALKVRPFSSRMDVERRRMERDAQMRKSTVKDLHKVLAEGFFYPLRNRFEIMMLQYSS